MERNNMNSMILGFITTTTVGTILFQALGTIILGLLGALGGYLFQRFIKAKLDKVFNKKSPIDFDQK